MKKVFLFIIIICISTLGHTKARKRIPAERVMDKKVWDLSATTVVKVKGQPDGASMKCQTFDISIGSSINFNIVCGAKEEQRSDHSSTTSSR